MRNPLNSAAQLVSSWSAFQPQIEAWVDRSNLEPVIVGDFSGYDTGGLPLTRRSAMGVPAVARARHLTAGTIAKLPLSALTGAVPVPDQPGWCQASDGQRGDLTSSALRRYGIEPQSVWARMLWTVDDLLFYGASLWLTTSRYQQTGLPARLAHVPHSMWSIDPDTGAVVDQDAQDFPADDVVLIGGPHEGILNYAQTTILTAGSLERTAADVALHPFRLELHQTTDVTLTPAERSEVVAEARRAMNANDGVLFTNAAIETKDHPLDSGDLLIAGRNAAALDIARHVSMPAAMIDAVATGASLEYQSTVARNQQWIDYGLSLYMDAVTGRLSMDDILPRGQRAAFDVTDLTTPVASPTGPATED